jgi:hypothetical protein
VVSDETKNWIAGFIERLGLPTVLLVGIGFFGYRGVVEPMAKTYREVIAQVGETNNLLRQEVESNDREDGERVKLLAERLDRIEKKIDELKELR